MVSDSEYNLTNTDYINKVISNIFRYILMPIQLSSVDTSVLDRKEKK